MTQLPTIDLAVFIAFVLGVVLFGFWVSRRNQTADDFMTAGRSLPGWVVGLSVFGTYLSSNTFLGIPGKAYGSNWNFFAFSLSLPLAVLIAVVWFVPFFRKTGEISAYHHLEHRFGPWARTYAVICYLLTQVARTGSIMFGVGLALQALLGWDIAAIIILTGVLVTSYTLIGGIAAVIWTDVVQSIILTIGALLAVGILLFDVPGGPSKFFEVARNYDKFSLGSFSLSLTESTFWVVLAYGFFINMTNFGIDQSFVQRYHTAKSERDATKALWLGALVYVPVSALFFFIGTALFVFYQEQPELDRNLREAVVTQELIKDGGTPGSPEYETCLAKEKETFSTAQISDKVFPYFIVHQFPAGLVGLLIAALFAAAMSSVDSSLNSSATVFTSDIYKRYVRLNLDDKGTLQVLHISTVIWGVAGTGVGLAMIGVESILAAWWELQGIFAGGLLGLFLLGLLSRRVTNVAAMTGVIIGVSVIAWMTMSKYLPDDLEIIRNPLHNHMTIVVGTLTIFLIGIMVSRRRNKMPDRSS